jgi:hypothetical protein
MAVLQLAPARTTVARLPRLLTGLVLCGLGISLMIAADLGLAPWDVLHQGISERTGIPIGTVAILVGFVLLLAWAASGSIPCARPVGLCFGCIAAIRGAHCFQRLCQQCLEPA